MDMELLAPAPASAVAEVDLLIAFLAFVTAMVS